MTRGKRLTPGQEQQIKRLLDEGRAPAAIAQEVGVGEHTVKRIRRAQGRRHQRCRTCGGLVKLPCVLCRARRDVPGTA